MPGKGAVPEVAWGKLLGSYMLPGLEKVTELEVALEKQASLGLG